MNYLFNFLDKCAKFALLILVGLVVTISGANYWVTTHVTSDRYTSVETVPYSDVALVLGTSRSVNGRDENPFFTHRIEAAAALFFAKKVKHILVSGDNSTERYNEPRDMYQALLQKGVPPHCITMDFAGLRTFDSVVRSHKIFQQKRITIVSQGFHNYRALYIAHHIGMDAVAYNAAYPKQASQKTIYREYFARVKALLDLHIFDAKPKFLGEKVDIRV